MEGLSSCVYNILLFQFYKLCLKWFLSNYSILPITHGQIIQLFV